MALGGRAGRGKRNPRPRHTIRAWGTRRKNTGTFGTEFTEGRTQRARRRTEKSKAGEKSGRETEERSLDPGEAHGAQKPRCATRRAKLRCGRENRVALLGMTMVDGAQILHSCWFAGKRETQDPGTQSVPGAPSRKSGRSAPSFGGPAG